MATLSSLGTLDWAALFGMGPSNLDSPASLAAAASFAAGEEASGSEGAASQDVVFQVIQHTNSAELLGQPDLPETTSHFLLLVREKTGR